MLENRKNIHYMDIFITLKDFVIFSFRTLFLLSLSYHTPFKKKKNKNHCQVRELLMKLVTLSMDLKKNNS